MNKRNEKTSKRVSSMASELLRDADVLLSAAEWQVEDAKHSLKLMRALARKVKSVAASALTQARDKS